MLFATLQPAFDAFLEAASAAAKWRVVLPLERQLQKDMQRAFVEQGALFLRGISVYEPLWETMRPKIQRPSLDFRETMTGADWISVFDDVAQATFLSFLDPLEATAIAGLTAGAEAVMGYLDVAGSFSLANPRAVQYVNAHGADNVRGINATTKQYLKTVIAQSVDEGWSYQKTAKAIKDRYAQFAVGVPQKHIRSRAELIAVTESGNAYEAGSEMPVRDLQDGGLRMEKSWLTVGDDRVEQHCLDNAAQGWIPFDDAFASGDSRALAHPACRCTTLYRRAPKEAGTQTLAGPLPEPIAPPPPPEPTPEPEPVINHFDDGFPNDLDRLVVERGLGGSTGAELVRDPADDKLYVRKRGRDAGHLREEMAADRAYQALGVNVPPFHEYDDGNGVPVKLSEFIPGRSLADLRSDPKAYAKAVKALQKDFAADALLGNWDVVGMGADNVLVDAKGKVWRIDNGGALRRRAQGALKPRFDKYTDDLWTMRNATVNKDTAGVFGAMGYEDVNKQMAALGRKRKALLDALPADLHDVMEGRLDTFAGLVNTNKVMAADKWNYSYLDNFNRHQVGVRQAGIVDKLPKKMTNQGVEAYDENGVKWDNLRTGYAPGNRSVVADVEQYINGQGGDYGIIKYWSGGQAQSSWSSPSQAFKYHITGQRGVQRSDYYWHSGEDGARQQYEATINKLGQKTYDETFAAWHAFNYEFVSNVQFTNNNTKKGTVKLIRTESYYVMNLHNMKIGDTGVITRGAVESTSMFRSVTVAGAEVTTQQVPHHRVFGNYLMERAPGYNSGMFLGDNENEMVAMLEGLEAKYER